jgi:hypothetical protein
MKNKKVSFDFDETLSRKDVQNFAKQLVADGYEVWIVTSRFATEPALEKGWYWVEKQNEELYEVANSIGIKKENIKFTEHVDKIQYLRGQGFLFHLDDDVDELIVIMESGDSCKPINVNYFDWENACMEILKLN